MLPSSVTRPLILLTNDDGYLALGLRALRDELARFADVVICAPESEQSATSHTLSIHRPLHLRRTSDGVFAVDGTPADCVYVALHAEGRVLPRAPDVVVSGLNHGPNLGADVFYSGTVGGAREGALRGILALAASAAAEADHGAAAGFAAEIVGQLLEHRARGVPRLMNLNIPGGAGPWRLRSTVLGARLYEEKVTFQVDPRGREHLWIGGATPEHALVSGSDTEAFDAGDASLTPLLLDLTAGMDARVASSFVAEFSAARPPG
ncbi:MAG: 5'/3'-nucleotidase SurE [Polyangiaceae bacterium]|nr:5'/3'-nucleotidase SurE [Polyangiaceae bacterium]